MKYKIQNFFFVPVLPTVYCGLVDAKIRAPDKDLPVTTSDPSLFWEFSFFEEVGVGFFEADGVGSLNNIVLDVDAQGPTSNVVYLICSIRIDVEKI